MNPIFVCEENDSILKRNFLCCCFGKHSSSVTPNNDPQINYEYVVEKLVIKRVPIKVSPSEENKIRPKTRQTIESKPMVFPTFYQMSPNPNLMQKQFTTPSRIEMQTPRSIIKSNKNIAPIHVFGNSPRNRLNRNQFGSDEVPMKLEDVYHYEPEVNIRGIKSQESFGNNGEYLLKKIASDLSYHKDIKWKVIIKKNRSSLARESSDSNASSIFEEHTDYSNSY